MIKLQINELLGNRSHWWLAQTTQIEYSVIRNLASQRSQRIGYATLEKLCTALDCQPGDLLTRATKARPRLETTDPHRS
jgi:DNA-binding Xre family transcriptional regulator